MMNPTLMMGNVAPVVVRSGLGNNLNLANRQYTRTSCQGTPRTEREGEISRSPLREARKGWTDVPQVQLAKGARAMTTICVKAKHLGPPRRHRRLIPRARHHSPGLAPARKADGASGTLYVGVKYANRAHETRRGRKLCLTHMGRRGCGWASRPRLDAITTLHSEFKPFRNSTNDWHSADLLNLVESRRNFRDLRHLHHRRVGEQSNTNS